MSLSSNDASSWPRTLMHGLPPERGSDNGPGRVPTMPAAASWLREAQQAGLARWSQLGFPTRSLEAWRYVRLDPVQSHSFRVPYARPGARHFEELKAKLAPYAGAHTLVFVNGFFIPELSNIDSLRDSGVELYPLASLGEPAGALWTQEVLAQASTEPAFAALNRAFWQDGVVLHVAGDAMRNLSEPVHLLHWGDDALQDALHPIAEPLAFHPRHLLWLEADSRLDLTQSFLGGEIPSRHFTNAVINVRLEPKAHLRLWQLADPGDSAVHMTHVEVRQHAGSRFEYLDVSLGSPLSRSSVVLTQEGEAAVTHLNGLYLVDQNDQVHQHTLLTHKCASGVSTQTVKGVIGGRARASFDGRIVIERGAPKTETRQLNNNLLLSDRAEADAKPQLEILADDVKASHGATVGRMQPEELFYIETRGIAPETARRLVLAGHVWELLAPLPLTHWARGRVERRVARMAAELQ